MPGGLCSPLGNRTLERRVTCHLILPREPITDCILGVRMTITQTAKLSKIIKVILPKFLQAGPGALEGVSSKLWLYQSLVNQAADDNSGLLGPIIITAPGKALPDGRPNDVDTEFVTIYKARRETLQCSTRQLHRERVRVGIEVRVSVEVRGQGKVALLVPTADPADHAVARPCRTLSCKCVHRRCHSAEVCGIGQNDPVVAVPDRVLRPCADLRRVGEPLFRPEQRDLRAGPHLRLPAGAPRADRIQGGHQRAVLVHAQGSDRRGRLARALARRRPGAVRAGTQTFSPSF